MIFSIPNLLYTFLVTYSTPLYLKFATFLGFIYGTYLFINFFRFLWNNIFIREKNLIGRYGHGTWAVITGAAEGLGKSFAMELGKRGFNLILFDRQGDRLNDVAQGIMMRYPEVEVNKVITDFRNCQKDGFFEVIETELKRYDISMLVNNLGILTPTNFLQSTDREVYDMMNVNLLTSVMMTKKLLPKMLNRGHKNAIITISDNEGLSTMPIFNNAYGTTKSGLIYFMESLKKEFSKNIDFLTLTPIRISGGKDFNENLGMTAADPDCYVNGSMKCLGNVNLSYASWKQAFWAPVFNNIRMARNFKIPSLKMPSMPKLRMPSMPKLRMPSMPHLKMPTMPNINLPTMEGMKEKIGWYKIPSWGEFKQQVRDIRIPTWRGIKQKFGRTIKTE